METLSLEVYEAEQAVVAEAERIIAEANFNSIVDGINEATPAELNEELRNIGRDKQPGGGDFGMRG